MAKQPTNYLSVMVAAIGHDQTMKVKEALRVAGYTIYKEGTQCPFGKNKPDPGLRPEDPCPVCGDLGTFDATDQPIKCIG